MFRLTVQRKSLRPRPFRSKVFTDTVEKELRRQGEITKRMFERATSTWNPPPKFTLREETRGQEGWVAVRTEDKRFHWVDKGTKIRWAVMARCYKPKSTYRTIGSRTGGGRVVVRGRKAMKARGIAPRPGIKAREISAEIMSRRRKQFYKDMREAIALGLRKARQ